MFYVVNLFVIFVLTLLVNVLVEFFLYKTSRDKKITEKNITVSFVIAVVISLYIFITHTNGF